MASRCAMIGNFRPNRRVDWNSTGTDADFFMLDPRALIPLTSYWLVILRIQDTTNIS
jgi:hypothetical protein